jgi:general secretion pathway protein A
VVDHDPYGLTDRPFQLTPDPRFYFDSATHRKAMTYLGYGLAQGEGFIVVTGEVGTGKTMLVGRLMGSIDRSRLTAVNLVSTQLEGEDILRIVALSLGIQSDAVAKGQLLARIERFLHEQARGGKRTLLIVDEAQNLPMSALEELRMLSNFQFGGQALLQIFLLGQPEFREALAQPRFEQLRQRVIATHHLTAMAVEEAGPYIMHRLACAGWKGAPRFSQDAFVSFHRLSGGIPRRLNMLAARVLLQGAIEGLVDIDAEVVDDVAADLASESIMPADPAALIKPVSPLSPEPSQAPSYAAEPVAPAPYIPEPPQPPVQQQPVYAPPAYEPPAYSPPPPALAPVVAPAPVSQPAYVPPAPQPQAPPVIVPPPEPAAYVPAYSAPQPAPEVPQPEIFSTMPSDVPAPSIAQPPRYDGDVPPEAVATPTVPSLPSIRPQLRAVENVVWPEPEAAPAPPPTPAPQPMPAPVAEPAPPPVAAPAPAPALEAAVDAAQRNAELEARLAEQEKLLRRTLALLVELVENTDPPAGDAGDGKAKDGGSQNVA